MKKNDKPATPRLVPLAIVGLLLAPPTSTPVEAGAYIFAGEANGVDLILHPQGYTGAGGVLNVEVCLDSASLVPAGDLLTDYEQAIRNNVAIWNQLQPVVGNSLLNTNNNIPSGQLDFESVALHELGHCIGLAHVNAASESGLPGADRDYTKATDGINNSFDLNPGPDGIRGSCDDVRGDDLPLHWYRTDTNDPGELPLPVPVDASTYDRDLVSLPASGCAGAAHDFPTNLDRTVAGLLGYPDIPGVVDTEAVMQQGTFSDEDQRRVTADGVATVLLGMSGLDETAGTADDYVINLTYGGIKSSCDLIMRFTSMSGLAFCSVSGQFLAPNHFRIGPNRFMEYGVGFNWFANQEGPCRQELDLVTGQWKQMALSCAPPSGGDTVATLLGDDLTGTYDVNWVVYERDAANDNYNKLALTDAMTVGRGYWIKTNQASQTVNIEEGFNATGDFPLETDPAGRFNMVGHRYWYDEAWSDVRVIDGASVLTLDQADPAGACQGPNPLANGCVMSRIAHKFNGAAYDAFDGQTPGLEGTLENFDGFWVKAFKPGIALRIPEQRSTPAAPHEQLQEPLRKATVLASAPAVTIAAEPVTTFSRRADRRLRPPPARKTVDPWFMRLIAEAGELRDAGNVLGQLDGARSGYDSHDLMELAPFGSDYLSIVFPHENWGARSGDYTSDYRDLGRRRGGASERWRFDVLTSEPATEVTLRWEGDDRQVRGSHLINHVTGEKIDVQPGGSYTFVTTAERNPFSWHVGSGAKGGKR